MNLSNRGGKIRFDFVQCFNRSTDVIIIRTFECRHVRVKDRVLQVDKLVVAEFKVLETIEPSLLIAAVFNRLLQRKFSVWPASAFLLRPDATRFQRSFGDT